MHPNILANNLILKTREYDKFKWLAGNRDVSERYILQLQESVLKDNLLHLQPVVVNEYFEIIDRQHKFEVARRNNLPVYYITQAGLRLRHAQLLNVLARTWKASDFLGSYVKSGKPAYVNFKEFLGKFPKIPLTAGIKLYCADARGKGLHTFKEGKMDLKRAGRAVLVAEIIYHIATLIDKSSTFIYTAKFIEAMWTLSLAHRFDKEMLYQKIIYSPMALKRQLKNRDYVENLLSVYNGRNKKPINIKGFQQYYDY